MSGFQLVASLVGSLAWPVAVVVAVVVLRRPLAAAMGRVKHVEAAGVAVELAEVEQARESVEEELAQATTGEVDVDELVKKAAELGWILARAAPGLKPDVIVDRSGDQPVVRSRAEEQIMDMLDRDIRRLERQELQHREQRASMRRQAEEIEQMREKLAEALAKLPDRE